MVTQRATALDLHLWRRGGAVGWMQFRHSPIPVRAPAVGPEPPAVAMFGWELLIREGQDRLRQTPLARTAWVIYTDVVALQGPGGRLATLELQRHPARTVIRPRPGT